MGRPLVVVSSSAAAAAAAAAEGSGGSGTATSWVDYWIDNTNYCAFFGCQENENTGSGGGGGNGCCVGSSVLLSHLDPTYKSHAQQKHRASKFASDGCTTSMSRSFRIRSACGADTVEEDDDDNDWSLFATKHDAFLDSLLHEQQQQLWSRSHPSANIMDEDVSRRAASPSSSGPHVELNTSAMNLTTTHSWSLSPTSSTDSVSDNGADHNGTGSTGTRYNSDGSVNRKRRRGLLLVATPRISQHSVAATATTHSSSHSHSSSMTSGPPSDRPPLSHGSGSLRTVVPFHNNSANVATSKAAATDTAMTSTSSKVNEPPHYESPESFLHAAVRLQKDKGKGSDVGSDICAKGVPACVGKLRQKMQLLTEHCSVQPQPNGTTTIATTSGAVASMKRRNAIISARHATFLETRSLITLRMGFLSMTYGVLLRWDIGKTGLVTVVVLRKNCHESFYRKMTTEQRRAPLTKSLSMPSPELRRSPTLNSVSPDTSLDEDDERDDIVRLNQAPYLVPRPIQFAPSEITVSVLYATGLNKKSHWTVQLQLGDQIENILLSYDGAMMLPKLGGPLQYTIPSTIVSNGKKSLPSISSGNMDAVLDIRLLEHKVRRKTRVLRCSMVLPLYSLEASSSTSTTTSPASTQLRIPCPDGAAIQLEATLVSDEAIWQREELAARQKQQEQQRKWWRGGNHHSCGAMTKSPNTPMTIIDDETADKSSSWDWLFCSLC